jgi:hypothetical protein
MSPLRPRRLAAVAVALAIAVAAAALLARQAARTPPARATHLSGWQFAVSGDSRNCGDIVMPAIAARVREATPAFYWHLGDFRKIYDFDEDFARERQRAGKPLTIIEYENEAWDDFLANQVMPFGDLPVMLGIGNHETIPPKSREQYLVQFADWLALPSLRDQRLADDPADHRLHAYYHWVRGGVDFVNLDNATAEQFDTAQMSWFTRRVRADIADPSITTLVVGMHKALPDSLSAGHSMNETPAGEQSGRAAYRVLLEARAGGKKVYLLASHSHFFMEGIFNTPAWRGEGILPGWIVGTAGAIRYPLPPGSGEARAARTKVYGFLLATVGSGGDITFDFHEVKPGDVPGAVTARYGEDFVRWCFEENTDSRVR